MRGVKAVLVRRPPPALAPGGQWPPGRPAAFSGLCRPAGLRATPSTTCAHRRCLPSLPMSPKSHLGALGGTVDFDLGFENK